MTNCLTALCFWKKRPSPERAYSTQEKPPLTPHTSARSPPPAWQEKPPLEVAHFDHRPPSANVPVRSHVHPAYSAYSTPVNLPAATSSAHALDYGATLKEQNGDEEEAARRRKAAQEEQERLDFFQMM